MKTTQQQYEKFIEEYEEMKAKYDILVNECNWQDDEITRLKEENEQLKSRVDELSDILLYG